MSEVTTKDVRARILIVEDEQIIAQNLKIRLEKLGYSVTDITIDAEETRKALEQEVPDLVLMDIALYGGNDGVILAKWIDKNYKIPVIYVTSHTDTSTFERASKSMPYGYLIKPFNPKELYNAIELALQRHKLLVQLSSSSHLLGSVLQSIGDAIVVTDLNKRVLYMNDSAERLLGLRYDDVGNRSAEDLLPFRDPDSSGEYLKWDTETLEASEQKELVFESHLKIRRKEYYLDVRISSLHESFHKDAPKGFLIVLRDITRRRKSENIIVSIASSLSRETGQSFFQTLTHHLTKTLEADYALVGEIKKETPDKVFVLASSSATNKPLDFTAASIPNTPLETLCMNSEPVHISDSARETYPDDPILSKYDIKAFFAQPLLNMEDEVIGVLLVMNTGELEQTEIQKSVLRIFANRASGELERRRYEERLIKERNRANEMNALKNNFLSNMSHEVRTPLNSIIGFASLMTEEVESAEHKEFLGFITEGGQRLLRTINDLLDLSILESEPDKIERTAINLDTEISEAVAMLSNQATDKNIMLDYIIHKPGVLVWADPKMSGQVLRKLIENAIKFTDKGSALVEADIEEKEKGRYGVIRVSDTGIGIKEAFLPFIFDEFKQESDGIARKYEGVGLGLTIAKKMTDLMDGFIEVESEKGKGSVFSLYLPLAEEK
ncbi:ATP-binding protein [Balneolaceae bacterium ANBcel3]|nr:ATP-binding protein [Balneolaceae bacterium ANBcel3]